MTEPLELAVTTLSTPAGSPASSRIRASMSIDSGVSLAGLTTIVQPAAIAGPILRVPIASGKFHGVMNTHGPTGCFIVSSRPGAGLVHREAPVAADGLLGVPAQEARAVGDLGLGLGQRLAHLERHEQRELVGARDNRLVGAAQDVGALARGALAPVAAPGVVGGGERVERVLRRGVGDAGDLLAGRGVLDGERLAAGAVAPRAADVELLGDGVEDGPSIVARSGHGARRRRLRWQRTACEVPTTSPRDATRAGVACPAPGMRRTLLSIRARRAAGRHRRLRRGAGPGRLAARRARRRLRPRHRHEPVRRVRLRREGHRPRDDPAPLLLGHGDRPARRRRPGARAAEDRRPDRLRLGRRVSPAGAGSIRARRYVATRGLSGAIGLRSSSGRELGTYASPLAIEGAARRPAAPRPQRQRRRRRALPRQPGVPRLLAGRRVGDQRDRRSRTTSAASSPARCRRAGRRRRCARRPSPRARTRWPRARTATASTSTPTRARRSTTAISGETRADRRGRRGDRGRDRRLRRASRSSRTTSRPRAGAPRTSRTSSSAPRRRRTSTSVEDPYDDASPRHKWVRRMSLGSAQRRLGSLVKGSLTRIRVLRRGRSPRVVAAQVVGTRRAHVGQRPGAAPPARALRHVGALHGHHRERDARRRQHPGRPRRRSCRRPVDRGRGARRPARRR